MLKEKSCKCGASKKRFMYDIGSFFVGQCCLDAGYDDLGNKKAQEVKSEVQEKKSEPVPAPEAPKPAAKLGKGKLKDMKVDELKSLAKEKGIEGADGMTKKQLVAALLQ